MAPKKRKVNTPRVKKKKWFPIIAPKLFNEVQLGESYVSEIESLDGRYITANLSTITRSMRKQTINMQFRINKIADGKAYTEVVGYSMINAAVKRLVRRGRDKVADSFLTKTKELKVLRVKPLVITQHKGTKSLQTAIRLEARRVVREYIFGKQVEDVFNDIADGKLQKQIKEAVSSIFPVKSVDIRMAKLEENANVKLTEDAVITESVSIRKKEKDAKSHKTEEEIEAEKLAREAAVEADKELDASIPVDEEDAEDFGDDDEEEADEEVAEDEAEETTEEAPEAQVEEADEDEATEEEAEAESEETDKKEE